MLVFYKDPLDVRSRFLRDALESPQVERQTEDMVHCLLVPSYPPNRSFVAQYDVLEAPALIVIHPDGTYHRLKGAHNAEEVATFLASSEPPGRRPEVNPRIPQGNTLDYFNVYERAVEHARRQNRRLFIIHKWWLDPASTELIRRVSKPDVTRYLADAVVCILDWDYVPNRGHLRAYGVTSFPAIVMQERDGRYRALSGVPTVEELIRFIVSSRGEESAAASEEAATSRVADPAAGRSALDERRGECAIRGRGGRDKMGPFLLECIETGATAEFVGEFRSLWFWRNS